MLTLELYQSFGNKQNIINKKLLLNNNASKTYHSTYGIHELSAKQNKINESKHNQEICCLTQNSNHHLYHVGLKTVPSTSNGWNVVLGSKLNQTEDMTIAGSQGRLKPLYTFQLTQSYLSASNLSVVHTSTKRGQLWNCYQVAFNWWHIINYYMPMVSHDQ